MQLHSLNSLTNSLAQSWARLEPKLIPLAPAQPARKHKFSWYLLALLVFVLVSVLWVVGQLVSSAVTQIFFPETQEKLTAILKEQLDPKTPLPGLYYGSLAEAGYNILMLLVFGLIYYWMRKHTHISLLGRIQTRKSFLRLLGFGLLFSYALRLLPSFMLQEETPVNQAIVELYIGNMPLWLGLLQMAVLAPLVEEFIFRQVLCGYLFNGSWLGVIVSSFVFALMHEQGLNWGLTVYFGIGFSIGVVYKLSQSLVASISLHALNNFIAACIIYLSLYLGIS